MSQNRLGTGRIVIMRLKNNLITILKVLQKEKLILVHATYQEMLDDFCDKMY